MNYFWITYVCKKQYGSVVVAETSGIIFKIGITRASLQISRNIPLEMELVYNWLVGTRVARPALELQHLEGWQSLAWSKSGPFRVDNNARITSL